MKASGYFCYFSFFLALFICQTFTCDYCVNSGSMSELAQAKMARRLAKTKLTKACNRLSRDIINETDPVTLTDQVNSLKSVFDEFISKHELVTGIDDAEEIENQKYYLSSEKNYLDVLTRVQVYIKEKVTENPAPSVERMQADMVKLLSLPKLELETFDGDP